MPIKNGVGIELFDTEAKRDAAKNKNPPRFEDNQFTLLFSLPNAPEENYWEPFVARPSCTSPSFIKPVTMKQVVDPTDGSDQLILQIQVGNGKASTAKGEDEKLLRTYYCY